MHIMVCTFACICTHLALARALIRDPAVLVLDEVTSALDPENELAIAKTLKGLCANHNKTIIMFTHSKGLIDMADKVYRLEKGQLIK
jgi:ABC-type bacteriocin/lantibiotic exporter with double-glycine peptidase domain